MSALISYRDQSGAGRFRGRIAYLTETPEDEYWEKDLPDQECFKGAAEAAARRGHELVYTYVGDLSQQAELGRRLYNDGIRGILLRGREHSLPESWKLDWSLFSCIMIYHAPESVPFHRVASNHSGMMRRAMHAVHQRGYRRPAFISIEEISKVSEYRWEATYRQFLHLLFPGSPLLIHYLRAPRSASGTEAARFIHDEKPDVIIFGGGIWMARLLAKEGLRMPDDVGFLSLDVREDPSISGFFQVRHQIGASSMEMLDSQLVVDLRGPVDYPCTLLVDGQWQEGTTLLPLSEDEDARNEDYEEIEI